MAGKKGKAGGGGGGPGRRKEASYFQGTLDLLVLRALTGCRLHGYAIVCRIREGSGEVFQVEEGSLYVSLHRMERRGWVEAEWGRSENNRRARYYRLTEAGRERLAEETEAWGRYSGAVARMLGGGALGDLPGAG